MTQRRLSPEGRGADKAPVQQSRRSGRVVLPEDPDQRSRYQRFQDGDLDVSELTLDELTKGRFMDKDGMFRGGGPEKMDRTMYLAFTRELQKRMQGRFQTLAIDAIDTIADVMFNGEGEQISQFEKRGTKRLDAAKYVVERIMGKIPDKLEVSAEITPWQQLSEGNSLFVDVGEIDATEVFEEEAPTPPPRRRSPRVARTGDSMA